MADRPGGPRDDERVSEPVLDWIDEIAEAEGLSREAAVEYLVSSYWRLEEIVDLLEAGQEPSTPDARGEGSETGDDRSELDDLHARFDKLLDDLQSRETGRSEEDEFRRSVVELADRLERLEAVLETEAGTAAPEPTPEPPSLEDRIAAVEGRLESISAELDDGSREDTDELDDRLSAVERRLESVRAELDDVAHGDLDELAAAVDDVERRAESLAGELESVESRVEAVAETAASEEQLDAMTRQVRSFQSSITTRHESLHDRVHAEFTHIRTILEHLLDATKANEARLDGAVDELEAALRSERADREALAGITRTANRRGVSTADCEHCGESVDIAMLQTAECPGCERAFDDLETTGGLFGLFPSSTLTVRGGRRPDRD